MKSTHQRKTRRETPNLRPSHPSQIREDVKKALTDVQEKLAQQDATMESALLAAHREARLGFSIPELCQAAMACPDVTLRMAFQIVAVQTGYNEGHVRRLYYRAKFDQPRVIRLKKEE